jgi:hypothetical protein
VVFYEQLIRISPALGTRAGYAAAVAEAKGPGAGLVVLDAIDPDVVSEYQPLLGGARSPSAPSREDPRGLRRLRPGNRPGRRLPGGSSSSRCAASSYDCPNQKIRDSV